MIQVVNVFLRSLSVIFVVTTDTIISWTDPEVATDLALSFQETMGCSLIW